jgi:translation initiation factor 2B subunit (eIF-2B alpha/beta/delta family)
MVRINLNPRLSSIKNPSPETIMAKRRISQLKALNKLIDYYRTEAAKKPKSPVLRDAISLRDDLLKEIAGTMVSTSKGIRTISDSEGNDGKNA